MAKARVFISFDFDHDLALKTLLVGQSRHPDSPFEIVDFSIKEHVSGDWKSTARRRIRSVEQICILCGSYTDRAPGVAIELGIAKEEGKPYFLLAGKRNFAKPTNSLRTDNVYEWTWDNLKRLIAGRR